MYRWDLAKDAAPLWPPAVTLYDGLAKQMVWLARRVCVCARTELTSRRDETLVIQATGGLMLTDVRNPVFRRVWRACLRTQGTGFLRTCT
jgi:hypothetical protein